MVSLLCYKTKASGGFGGACSNFVSVEKFSFFLSGSGMRQGSILRPLVYNVYVYDIYTSVQQSRFLNFADVQKTYAYKINNIEIPKNYYVRDLGTWGSVSFEITKE